MPTFGTFGPGGSNHDRVAARDLALHRLEEARIELFENFGPDDA